MIDTCATCNAADLIRAALEIINPDDCTVEFVSHTDCGKVRFVVNSDDCGRYVATATVTTEAVEA